MPRVFRSKDTAVLNERTSYVFVNVVVNLAFLLRSYVAMRVLGYQDLGLVALVQTIILLVGALQFGVLNGGYRLLCSETGEAATQINNLVYTFVGVLTLVLFAVAGCSAALFPGDAEVALMTLLGIFAGIPTILRNWMTNQLIATVRLRKLNQINMLSALVSLTPLLLVSHAPLPICLASIVLQPLVFVVYLLVIEPGLRPTGWSVSAPLFRRILAAGFVMFLTGIFLTVNSQIERWSIVSCIGVAGLGRYYLALLFLNLYNLVPTSLGAVFLPRLVQTHVQQDRAGMQQELQTYFRVTLYYSAAVMLCVWPLAGPVIALLLPKYLPDLRYVYLLAPGVLIFGLSNPLMIAFNVLIQYRYYFYAYGLGTVATAGLVGLYILITGTIDLDTLSIIKSAVYVLMTVIITAGYLVIVRNHPEFRFELFGGKGAAAA
jgi:O-antigen/teichoic acid export membrane protein